MNKRKMKRHYFTQEEKEQIKEICTPDYCLDAYGLLGTAKRGYNPFRDDEHPGSFKKLPRDSSYYDYAESKRYTAEDIVAAQNGWSVKADYYQVIVEMDRLAGTDFASDLEIPEELERKPRKHIPNMEECELLGIRARSTIYLPIGFASEKPEDPDVDYKKDEDGTYIILKAAYRNPWDDMTQGEIDMLVTGKCMETAQKYNKIILALTHPDANRSFDQLLWEGMAKAKIRPMEMIKTVKDIINQLDGIAVSFGRKRIRSAEGI